MAEKKGYRVNRSNRRVLSCDYSTIEGCAKTHVEIYDVRFWDRYDEWDYEFQKFADVYPSSISEMENVIHCFGLVWQPVESLERALELLTEDYVTRRGI